MFEIEEECGLKLIKDLVKDTNLSRIYGFILYSQDDVFMKSVLDNKFIWDELDKISGMRWPIFVTRPLEPRQKKRPFQSSGSSIELLVDYDFEPIENLQILSDFGLSNSKDLPCFVAFMWDDQDMLHSISIPIHGNGESAIYLDLKKIVTSIAKVEAYIEPQYKRNVEVFRNVQSELAALKLQYKFKSFGKIVGKFAEFLSTLV